MPGISVGGRLKLGVSVEYSEGLEHGSWNCSSPSCNWQIFVGFVKMSLWRCNRRVAINVSCDGCWRGSMKNEDGVFVSACGCKDSPILTSFSRG